MESMHASLRHTLEYIVTHTCELVGNDPKVIDEIVALKNMLALCNLDQSAKLCDSGVVPYLKQIRDKITTAMVDTNTHLPGEYTDLVIQIEKYIKSSEIGEHLTPLSSVYRSLVCDDSAVREMGTLFMERVQAIMEEPTQIDETIRLIKYALWLRQSTMSDEEVEILHSVLTQLKGVRD